MTVAALLALVGCSPSDVGDQSDPDPEAVAAVLGLGEPVGGAFQARAASDVALTAKDSDSDGAPILEYQWTQVSGPAVDLFERNNVTRVFTAPAEAATLEFELVVTDANGKESTDTVMVDVLPVLDDESFLRDPSVEETLFLFVSPDPGPATVAAAIPWTVTVTPEVFWTDRSGTPQSQVLDAVLTASGQIDAGFVIPGDPVDTTQSRIELPVPLLDIDQVNAFFQGANRASRIELEEVRNVQVELTVALAGTGDFAVHAGVANGATFTRILASDLVAMGETPLGSEALVDDADADVRLDLESIRRALGVESFLSASNYYDCIDPTGQSATLSGWLTQAGFDGATDVVHAQYVNNYDLGFGRDMFARVAGDGSVYSYVVNYPSLEALLKGQGEFATVAMEFSAKPEGTCDAPTASATDKIVKFYAFVPDTTTGEMVRMESMNFDGRGERFLPGVCTACHDGSITNIAALGQSSLASISADNVDLSATFMPWDVDSLLFSRAADAALVDPSLNTDDLTEAQIEGASLEAQQDALRELNETALATYVGDLRRYEEPLRLIHGWYGNAGALPAPIVDDTMTMADETDDISATSPLESALTSTLIDLPDVDFDGDYVQPGWVGEEDLYRDVYARYCRMCHTQQDDLAKNFESHAEFIDAGNLERFVYEKGVMPAARLTMDRFWVDFAGGTSAGDLLRAEPEVTTTATPGQPSASISQSVQTVETIDGAGELVATTINLDGSGSFFAETYDWRVTNDCGAAPTVLGATSAQASFVVDDSPCEYTITLEVDAGVLTDTAIATVTTNRVPETVDFVAPTTGYLPGDADLDIDVLAEIGPAEDGDGNLMLVVNDSDFGLLINTSVTDVGPGLAPGEVRFTLDSRLGGTSDSFQYQILDDNGSESVSIGVVDVDIDPIAPTAEVRTGSLSETGVILDWSVPTGFVADQYAIERDGPTPNGTFLEIATTTGLTYTDSTLGSGEDYDYRVVAQVASETSDSNTLNVSTTVGVPTGLMSSAVTTSTVSLSWSAGPGSAPDSYTIYRDSVLLDTTVGAASTNYVDDDLGGGLGQNSTFTYEITQTRNGVESGLSASSDFTTDTAPVTGFTAAAVFGESDEIDLDWTAPVGGVAPSSYNIYRGGGFLANTASTSYTDTGLTSDTSYSYQVGAVGTNGESTRASDSDDTNLSIQDVIADMGLGSATTNAGSYPNGCLSSGCHMGETDASLRARLTQACVTDDTDMSDCSGSMAGISIGSAFRDLVSMWNATGAAN